MKGYVFLVLFVPLAVASAATIKVTSTADNLTGGNAQCTLREAIANANAAADTTSGDCAAGTGAGDTIRFTFAMPATIRLRLGELLIQRDVSLVNPAPGSLHIDGAHKSRVFEIAAGSTSMTNLTIEHGRILGNGGGILVDNGATLTLLKCVIARNLAKALDESLENDGGGILNAGVLDLTDCRLIGNTVVSDSGAAAGGGGIHNAGGRVTLTNCTLTRNTAHNLVEEGFGGAISNHAGVLTVTGCKLLGNRAIAAPDSGYTSGGGIWNDVDGIVTLSNSTLTRNRASAGGDTESEGGGLYNEGIMMVTGCRLSRNVVRIEQLGESFGGGIANEGGTLTLTSCALEGNAALNRHGSGFSWGGGIFNGSYFGGNGAASMTMADCTLSRNRTVMPRDGDSSGAGIYSEDSMSMTNCTIAGNRSTTCTLIYACTAAGAGLFGDGPTNVTNCTFSGNTVQRFIDYQGNVTGGAIFGSSYPITLTNTIVANSGSSRNCVGWLTSGGHNLSSDGTCFTSGGSDLLNTKPRLAPLADYGGATRTMALCTDAGVPVASCRAASPAIDAGGDAVTGAPDDLSIDQRGLPRKVGAHVDIGAYEAP